MPNSHRRNSVAPEVYLTKHRKTDSRSTSRGDSGFNSASGRSKPSGRSSSSQVSYVSLTRDRSEAFCIEGDVERLEDRLEKAASAYCRAYSEEPKYAIGHLKTIPKESLDSVIKTLEEWCPCTQEAQAKRSRNGITINCDQICEFLLGAGHGIAPSSIPANSTRVDLLFKEKKYKEVIDRCTGLLDQYPLKPTRVILQRGLAYLLIGKREKNAISDYLKAFLEDEEETEMYIRNCQKEHLTRILELFRKCANSDPPKDEGTKALEQWRRLVIDCHKFVLAFKPNDSKALLALANNLKEVRNFKDAITALTSALQGSRAKSNPSMKTIIELLVLRSDCYLGVDDGELAVKDLITSMHMDKVSTKTMMMKLLKKPSQREIVVLALEMAEKRLYEYKKENRVGMVNGIMNKDTQKGLIKQAIQFYRLIMIIAPKHKHAMASCGECLCLEGNHTEAVLMFNTVLEVENVCSTLCARGMCHFHLGDLADGLDDFSRAVDDFPDSIQALCGRGYANLLTNDSRAAVKDYLKAISMSIMESVGYANTIPLPQQQKLQHLLRKEVHELFERARKMTPSYGSVRERTLDNGKKILETALDIADFLKYLDEDDVSAWLLKVDALRRLQRQDEAERELIEFVDRHPDNEVAMVHLSNLRMKFGKSNQAVKDYLDVLRMKGSTGIAAAFVEIDSADRIAIENEAHRYAVQLLEESRTPETFKDAIDCFTVAIAASGVRATKSLLARAECYAHLGDQVAAIADFSTVLNHDPNIVEALCGRACMQLTLNHQQETVVDYLRALTVNFDYTKNHIASLPEQPRLLVIYWLHQYTMSLLSQDSPNQNDKRTLRAKLIGQLLVALDEENSTWHGLYADALIVEGDYETALAHLNKVTELSPDDLTAVARCALIHVKLGNMDQAVLQLGKLAEDDLQGLNFVLKVLDPEQHEELAKFASNQAENLSRKNRHEEALHYHSLAVLSTNATQPDILRKRAKCLARLEKYNRAERDLSLVLKLEKTNPLMSDYCARGHIYLLHEKEHPACNDYIRALDLNASAALSIITSKPGRANLARVFYNYAQYNYDNKKFPEALMVADFGLQIDEKHMDLRKLKSKTNKQMGRGCVIQ
ncbi:uncharacterized protein LOC144451177 [Glandiceps talaboti]